MSEETWSAVDQYLAERLVGPDAALEGALQASVAAGLPAISVSPSQGKLLNLLARSIGARSILEIGTLGGYSTIWLARALAPGGQLVTLEADPRYAEVAGENIRRAGLAELVQQRVGPALETLPEVIRESSEPFDLVFIDADKLHTPDYFSLALERTRPGGLLIADNVIRDGSLVDLQNTEPAALGSRRLHELLADEWRVSATTIQTVGMKGYDGFTLALVNPASAGAAAP